MTMDNRTLDSKTVNDELYKLYQDKKDYLDDKDINMFHICLQCPKHYCDTDNERILFVRLEYGSRFYPEFKNALDDNIQMYDNAVNNQFGQLDATFVDYMINVNKNLNPNKDKNFLCTYLSIYNKENENLKISDTKLYKRAIEVLKQEIEILQPKFIFFVDLSKLCWSDSEFVKINYESQYDFLSDLFGTDISINFHLDYRGIYTIEDNNTLNRFCFRVNMLDAETTNKLVNNVIHQYQTYCSALSTVKPYTEETSIKQNVINEIILNNFHSHTNTPIDLKNNLLALVGANDAGKTSVLEALDMFAKGDDAVKDHISVKINGNTISFDDIKEKRISINYNWFKTETYFNDDLKNKKISELLYFKKENTYNKMVCLQLRKQVYEILDIFKYVFDICNFLDYDIKSRTECGMYIRPSEDLKRVFDVFLKERDLLVLTYSKFGLDEDIITDNFDYIKDFYSDDDLDFIHFKSNIDRLYDIVKQFCLDFEKLDDIYEPNSTLSFQSALYYGLSPKLDDNIEVRFPNFLFRSLSSLLLEEVASPDSQLFDVLLEQQNAVKRQYLNGTDKISVIDDTFLKLYGYDKLLLKGSPKEIVDRTQEIKDNLDIYISRKLDNGIIDKWTDLLKDFMQGDNVPIENRGTGVQRLCSLFCNVVDTYRDLCIHKYPIVIAIDEVELSLHPKQQRVFINLLKTLSTDFQFIITTHSPYVVSELASANVQILKKENGIVKSVPLDECVLNYASHNISISEINYIAFDEPSIEYHIELFGYIHNKLIDKYEHDSSFQMLWRRHYRYYDSRNRRLEPMDIHWISSVDKWMHQECRESLHPWYNTKTYSSEQSTLPCCVRNHIDHPLTEDDPTNANKHSAFVNNGQYSLLSNVELSIVTMRNIIKTYL